MFLDGRLSILWGDVRERADKSAVAAINDSPLKIGVIEEKKGKRRYVDQDFAEEA
jgi:hypothetical protein